MTNTFLPNSTYTLSFQIDQGAVANLVNGTSLSLKAGGATVTTVTSAQLLALLNSTADYQTVTLVYKTGNTAPVGTISIYLDAAYAPSLGGQLSVTGFQLNVAPTSVVLAPTTNHGKTITYSGSGGAPNATYCVSSSTDVSAQNTSWTTLSTNQFDANGNFSLIITNDYTPQRFFKVYLP